MYRFVAKQVAVAAAGGGHRGGGGGGPWDPDGRLAKAIELLRLSRLELIAELRREMEADQ